MTTNDLADKWERQSRGEGELTPREVFVECAFELRSLNPWRPASEAPAKRDVLFVVGGEVHKGWTDGFTWFSERRVVTGNVTHWQPLPEPPKV